MSTFVTLLAFFSIYAMVLPSCAILIDFALSRWFNSQTFGNAMDMVLWPNSFVLRSVYFSLLGVFTATSSTLPSITKNWTYAPAGDGNVPFPFWWLITTVAVAAIIGGNLYVFLVGSRKLGRCGNHVC